VTHHVPGVTHRVPGVTHRVPGVTHRVPGVTHCVPGVTHRVPDVTHRVPDVTHRVPDVTPHVPGKAELLPPVILSGGWAGVRERKDLYDEKRSDRRLIPRARRARISRFVDPILSLPHTPATRRSG